MAVDDAPWPWRRRCDCKGGAVAVEEAFDYLDAPIERVTGADIPTPYAANLEKSAFPTVDDIVRAAERACYRSV